MTEELLVGPNPCGVCGGEYGEHEQDCDRIGVVMLKFKQIQCVPVPNTSSTQCNVYMYGLTEDGVLWFKRDTDDKWQKEPAEFLPPRK